MDAQGKSIALALARCGMACDNPTPAFIHQVERLKGMLDADGAAHVERLLDWRRSGRPAPEAKAVQSIPDDNGVRQLLSQKS